MGPYFLRSIRSAWNKAQLKKSFLTACALEEAFIMSSSTPTNAFSIICLTSPLVSTVSFMPSWRILTGKLTDDAVVRNSLKLTLISGFCISSMILIKLGIQDCYRWVFWNINQCPSSTHCLNMLVAILPWPWPKDTFLRDLPVSRSHRIFVSYSGSQPGVTMKIIGVCLLALLMLSIMSKIGGLI